jgi:hypothetical protein
MASTAGSSRVETRDLSTADHPAWCELVAESDSGSVYALPEYLDALCAATNARYRIVGAFLDGRLVGGVPLYERASRWGVHVGNRLLLYYNGLVLRLPPKKYASDATSQEIAVLDALAAALEGASYAQVQLHNRAAVQDVRPFLARGWQAQLSYTYVMPLADPAAQWERVDPNLRRLIGRCERDGVAYVEDDDFDALFRLHADTHTRKGAPLYLPREPFAAYYRTLKRAGLARLGHAVYQGRVIASQLMLTGPHPVAHTVCAGADDDFLRMGASAFLRWHACVALARDGYRANDLTDAALNPVTRFKSQLGGTLTPTWSLSRTDSIGFRLHSALHRWRAGRARRRAPEAAS